MPSTALTLSLVALGGAVGAVARYLLAGWAQRQIDGPFPLGTLSVNVIGCLLIGLLMHGVDRGVLDETTRLGLVVGLLGALTTFSTFGLETVELLHRREVALAFASVAANVVVGLLAVVGGFWLGRAIY